MQAPAARRPLARVRWQAAGGGGLSQATTLGPAPYTLALSVHQWHSLHLLPYAGTAGGVVESVKDAASVSRAGLVPASAEGGKGRAPPLPAHRASAAWRLHPLRLLRGAAQPVCLRSRLPCTPQPSQPATAPNLRRTSCRLAKPAIQRPSALPLRLPLPQSAMDTLKQMNPATRDTKEPHC